MLEKEQTSACNYSICIQDTAGVAGWRPRIFSFVVIIDTQFGVSERLVCVLLEYYDETPVVWSNMDRVA